MGPGYEKRDVYCLAIGYVAWKCGACRMLIDGKKADTSSRKSLLLMKLGQSISIPIAIAISKPIRREM